MSKCNVAFLLVFRFCWDDALYYDIMISNAILLFHSEILRYCGRNKKQRAIDARCHPRIERKGLLEFEN